MKKMRMILAVAVVASAVRCAFGAVDLNVTREGWIEFDGGGLSVVCYRPGWGGFSRRIDYGSLEKPVHRFMIVNGQTELFDGRTSWETQADGTVKGVVSLTCVVPAEAQCIALTASIPAVPASGLGNGTAQEFELPVGTGGTLRMRFDAPVRYHAQDSRKWGKKWSVRFGQWQERRKYAAGDRLEWNVTLSSPEGISLRQFAPYVIDEGDGWVGFDHRNDIVPGSALDFSGQGLQDAPAGKHGWLKAKGGRFEFEGLPGVEQRFYGVNLCFSANYLDHDLADGVVDRFVRCGYNSIRIHHHDGIWAASADNREKLDYLIAKCIGRGIYITTDLYVSRSVKWRDIGIDQDGVMNKQLYKTYVGICEPAFTNWCGFAKEFLSHVNPYTGRSYADEPGMPFISLINEGHLGMGWDAKRDDGRILAAWREFGGVGDLPKPWSSDTRDAYLAFDEWINAKIWTKCSAYVRSLGAKALLTNDNNGRRHGEGEGLTPRYDYVDNHFYVDHPSFLVQKWRLPSRCDNKNPIRAGNPKLFHAGWAKGASKPYTITEWNFSAPGRYRGMGGILTGALAAEQEWDGLWRFAYSHSDKNLGSSPNGTPGYFDCATDPVISASDRASVCLYLRRDAAAGSLRPDVENGAMALVSPRTCGGFAEAGKIDAGALSFSVLTNAAAKCVVPMTLWVSSLDGKPIADSSRMLLTHLTDVQGRGTKFMDATCTVLLKRGAGCVARSGAADVSLRLGEPGLYRVWALAANGARRFSVPCRVEGNALRFVAATRGKDGRGVMQYEICREAAGGQDAKEFRYNWAHPRLVVVQLMDDTDHHDELYFESEYLLSRCEKPFEVTAPALFVEDSFTGSGMAFFRQAPLPHARSEMSADWRVVPAAGKVEVLSNAYRCVSIRYEGGKAGRVRAATDFHRRFRPYVAGRDGLFLSNTWGDGNRDARINEPFLMREVEAGAELGVDVIQIDDGWQKGRSANSASRNKRERGRWGSWWEEEGFWDVDPVRFPNGLGGVVSAARSRGMKFGLWFAPDSSDDAANWRKDADFVLSLHRDLGIDYFKLDSLHTSGPLALSRQSMLMDRLMDESGGRITIDLDVTAGRRPGYFAFPRIGPVFVENRYIRNRDPRLWWPHRTLRNFWSLAHVVDPARLRMEVLNPERMPEFYPEGDLLAPARWPRDAIFAISMFASPLGWFEIQHLSPETVKAWKPLVARWKRERDAIHGGYIYPVGNAPDGLCWTGFVSASRDGNEGTALLFRELDESEEFAVPVSGYLQPGRFDVSVIGGRGEASVDGGVLRVAVREKLDFIWVKAVKKGLDQEPAQESGIIRVSRQERTEGE